LEEDLLSSEDITIVVSGGIL